MVRHRWMWRPHLYAWDCVGLQPDAPGDYDCIGCGISISESEYRDNRPEEIPPWWETENDAQGGALLDGLWHYKLRPMAGLVCLVEEANDQA